MIDFDFKIMPNSLVELSDGKLYASLNLAMNITSLKEMIIQVTFTQSIIEANLYSDDNGNIKGNIDTLQLGKIGNIFMNGMGLTKADFQG